MIHPLEIGATLGVIVLSFVLLLAGLSKYLDYGLWKHSISTFALPPALAACATIGLPLLEASLGVALWAQATRFGALCASILTFGITSLVIFWSLTQRPQAQCYCLGSSLKRVTPLTVLRAVVLTLLASTLAVLDVLQVELLKSAADHALLGFLLASFAAAVVARARVNQRRSRAAANRGKGSPVAVRSSQPSGLAEGSVCPDFTLRECSGKQLSAGDVIATDRPTLLVLLSPTCTTCRWLKDQLQARDNAESSLVRVVLVSIEKEGSAENSAPRPGPCISCTGTPAVARALRLPVIPAAILVGPDRRVMAPAQVGPDGIMALVRGRTGAGPG